MILGSLAGPFLGACGLLVVSGFAKVSRPVSALSAVKAVGLPLRRAGVIGVGLVELAVGIAGAIFGGFAAVGVAVCYVLLTLFAIQLLRRAPATPCACLGSSSAVVTRTHVVINIAAVVVAVFAAFAGPPLEQISGHWVSGAVFVVLVACCMKLAAMALESLPELAAATKEGTS